MPLEVDLPDFTVEQVTALKVIADTVRTWNGNVKGVHDVRLVTHDIDRAHALGVYPAHTAKHMSSWGVHFPLPTYWDPITRTHVRRSVIWISPRHVGHTERARTLIHEFAHANSATSHGFSWRRMYALLLPLGSALLDVDLTSNLRDQIHGNVLRYAKRYSQTSWTWREIDEKINAETDKHHAASHRCIKQFEHLVK